MFEYSLFASFIYINIKDRSFKKVIRYLSFCFIAFIIAYTIFAPFVRIDSIPIGLETILILIFSFYFLFEEMKDPTVLFLYRKYQFWIIIGFMLYLAGSLFIYLFANQLPQNLIERYWFIIDIFLLLKNIFFTTAILTFIQNHNEKTPHRVPSINFIS